MAKIIDVTTNFMPRLHMQFWQPGTERKSCMKLF